jgi:hypothetical protein
MGIEIEDEGFTAGQAARVLARAEAGWGRATYRLALGRLRKSDESRANDPDVSDEDRAYASDRGDLTGWVQAWITSLIDSIPQPDADGLVPLQPVVEAALQYAKTATARHSQLDHRAASALIDHIDDLRSLGAFSCTLGEALRFIRERVVGLHVAADRQRPATPVARTCTSSASKKVASFQAPQKIPSCSTANAPRRRRSSNCRATGSTNPCIPC